jgi:anti-sigma regulatory factor (Ser/Thr protein kinase)
MRGDRNDENDQRQQAEALAETLAQRRVEALLLRQARAQALAVALLNCDTPEACAETVLSEGIAAFGAAAGSVCLVVEDEAERAAAAGEADDAGAGEIVVVGMTGYPPESSARWKRWSINAPVPISDAARRGVAIYLSTVEEYLRLYPTMAAEPLTVNRSWAALPLLVKGACIGVLGLSFIEPQEFSDADRLYLEGLALQCAHAIERARLIAESRDAARRQRVFFKDVLASVTDGRFVLCDGEWDLPAALPPALGPNVGPLALSRDVDVRSLRLLAREAAQSCHLMRRRTEDLETAVGEAAMNALLHGGGGEGRVCADKKAGIVQVWVSDRGAGIELHHLPKATLQPGYTTAGTLGHGFKMIWASIDRVYLLTGPQGTTVVLEQGRIETIPAWL